MQMMRSKLLLFFAVLSVAGVAITQATSVFQVAVDERNFAYLWNEKWTSYLDTFLSDLCSYKNNSEYRTGLGTHFDCTFNDITFHIGVTDSHDFDQDASNCQIGKMRNILHRPAFSSSYSCSSTARPAGWPLCGYESEEVCNPGCSTTEVDCSWEFSQNCIDNATATGWDTISHDGHFGTWNEGNVTMGFNLDPGETWGTDVDMCDAVVFKARNSGRISFKLQNYSDLYIAQTINEGNAGTSYLSVVGSGNASLYHILSKGTGQVLTQTTGNISMVNVSNSADVSIQNSHSVIMADISHSTGIINVQNVTIMTGLNITFHSGSFLQTGGSIRMKDLKLLGSGSTVTLSQATLLLEGALSEAGTIEMDDIVLTGTQVTNKGTLAITKSASGTASVKVTGVLNSGTITVDGITDCNANFTTNTGTIHLLNGAVCNSVVESNSGGTINVTGAGAGSTLRITGAQGTIIGLSNKVTLIIATTPSPTNSPTTNIATTPTPTAGFSSAWHRSSGTILIAALLGATTTALL